MRFLRRFFTRRRRTFETEDHFIVEDGDQTSKNKHRNQISQQYWSERESRLPSPEQRDDHGDRTVVDRNGYHDGVALEELVPMPVPTPSSSEMGQSPVDAQLSRITEVPTILSSSTAAMTGSHRPVSQRVLPPPAREAAFHGPPRFDWMDIETNAAIKIQSIYRRNKVMQVLEKKGYSTSAIRNRKRRRKASRGKAIASADVPSIFSCCAVGLAFGDATEDDDAAYREFQKKQYEERVKQQQMHEDAIRKQYLRTQGAGIKVVEQIEVVE